MTEKHIDYKYSLCAETLCIQRAVDGKNRKDICIKKLTAIVKRSIDI